MMRKYVGVDLSASEKKPTYIAILSVSPIEKAIRGFSVVKVRSDFEILAKVSEARPSVVSIDAPLDLSNIDEKGLRPQDRCVIDVGGRILPLKTEGMRSLSERGVKLSQLLRKSGLTVIETHPYSSVVLLGFKSTCDLSKSIFNIELSKGEADALAAGYVAFLFDLGETINCGGDPPYILPRRMI